MLYVTTPDRPPKRPLLVSLCIETLYPALYSCDSEKDMYVLSLCVHTYLRDANPHTMAIAIFHWCVSFCEGWRPVKDGTPTLTEWPVIFFSCFWCCVIL